MKNTEVLESRSVLKVSGSDAEGFIQNLITCDIAGLKADMLTFGALLTPQGKILFEFLISRVDDGFLLDSRRDKMPDLIKRFTLYRLRADVVLEQTDLAVQVSWGDDLIEGLQDPRSKRLGRRHYLTSVFPTASSNWEAHRIDCGVPELGSDFETSSVFPHEALMDCYSEAGVDFQKGCYVGQEVVSRMQHRGTARNRFVHVETTNALSGVGSEILADGKTIGRLGSSVGSVGLALVRLDRAKKALDLETEITCDGQVLALRLPDFVQFDWPQ